MAIGLVESESYAMYRIVKARNVGLNIKQYWVSI